MNHFTPGPDQLCEFTKTSTPGVYQCVRCERKTAPTRSAANAIVRPCPIPRSATAPATAAFKPGCGTCGGAKPAQDRQLAPWTLPGEWLIALDAPHLCEPGSYIVWQPFAPRIDADGTEGRGIYHDFADGAKYGQLELWFYRATTGRERAVMFFCTGGDKPKCGPAWRTDWLPAGSLRKAVTLRPEDAKLSAVTIEGQ